MATVIEKAVPQKVRWAADHEGEAGMIVEGTADAQFIPWSELQPELERTLLRQLGRIFGDKRVSVSVQDWHGRKNWVMRIVDDAGALLGSVWLGGDPENGWRWDGLVRVGRTESDHDHVVWQVFERYSDGSYRRIIAKDTPADRLPQ